MYMKKKIILILISVIIACLFSTVAFGAEQLKYGDANCDGKVNIKDATHIQRCVANLAKLEDGVFIYADVDANNSLNIKDATIIQKFIAGIIGSFPAQEKDTQPVPSAAEGTEAFGTTASSQATEPASTEEKTSATEDATEPASTTPAETSPEATDPVETTAPETSAPTKPSKPSVDGDGYYNEVIRP